MGTLTTPKIVFTIPLENGNDHILFAPLHRIAIAITNPAAKALENILSENPRDILDIVTDDPIKKQLAGFLSKHNLLQIPATWAERIGRSETGRSRIVLSITSKCNLRCSYCYAGIECEKETMELEVAKEAIDGVIKHALLRNNEKFGVKFHGGGEAYVEKRLLHDCVEHIKEQARKHNLTPSLGIVTNMTLIDEEEADWLKENDFIVTASFDGEESIQNSQRPLAGGKGSFEKALRGIKLIAERKVPFEIRATVTPQSVSSMETFVRFLAGEVFTSGTGRVHFEPVSICGRALEEDVEPVDPKIFCDNYLVAFEAGKTLGVEVVCSFDTLGKEKVEHCGTSRGEMVCVTPTGLVSACTRVTKEQDEGSELLLYGKYDDTTGTLVFYEDKAATIKQHCQLPKMECSKCFARWGCQGHCPVARYENPEYVDAACFMVRYLLIQRLQRMLQIT